MSETLEQLRTRERELELEAVAVRARVEEVRTLIKIIEQLPRRRQRGMRVAGGTAQADASLPWEDEDEEIPA